jgi:hypothetical protein
MLGQNFGIGTKLFKVESAETDLTMLPSDYFRRQCLAAAFPEDLMIAEALALTGDNIAVVSDWPHPVVDVHSDGLLGSAEKRRWSDC